MNKPDEEDNWFSASHGSLSERDVTLGTELLPVY